MAPHTPQTFGRAPAKPWRPSGARFVHSLRVSRAQPCANAHRWIREVLGSDVTNAATPVKGRAAPLDDGRGEGDRVTACGGSAAPSCVSDVAANPPSR